MAGAAAAVTGLRLFQATVPSAGDAVWAEQALFVVPSLLGPLAAIASRPTRAQQAMAMGALGANLGLLLHALLSSSSRAPLLATTPCVVALALTLQTARRTWRERHTRWPTRPLARALRITLPLQVAGPSAYVLVRTDAAVPGALRRFSSSPDAPPAAGWTAPTALGAGWEAVAVTLAALTVAGMLIDGTHARAPQVHRHRAGSQAAMWACAAMAAAALLQAGTLCGQAIARR